MLLTPASLPAILRVAITGIFLFFVPGWLVQSFFLNMPNVPLIARPAVAFSLSVAGVAMLGVLTYLAGGNLAVVQLLVATWTVMLILVATLGRFRLARPGNYAFPRLLKPEVLVLLLALLCAGLALYGKTWLSHRADGFYHLATIRRQIETGSVLSQGAIYANQPPKLDSIAGTWHLSLAIFSIWSGIDMTWLWSHLPALIAPLLVLAFYAFAQSLVRQPWLALFCTLAQFVLWDKLDFRASVYSNQAGYVLLWVALMLTFTYLDSGSRKALVAALVLGLVMVSWHLLIAELFFVGLSAYLVFRGVMLWLTGQQPWSDTEVRRLLVILVPVLVLVLPFLTVRVLASDLVNLGHGPLIATRPTFRASVRLPGGLSFINPGRLYFVDLRLRVAPLRFTTWVFPYLAVPFLIPVALKRRRDAIYLLASLLTVPFVLLNPIMITLLQGKVTDVPIVRLILLPPYGLILVWSTWIFVQFWVGQLRVLPPLRDWTLSVWGRALGLIISAAVVVLAAIVVMIEGVDNLRDLYSPHSTSVYSFAASIDQARRTDQGPYLYLYTHARPNAVIASDPESSYYLTGLTGCPVVAVPQGHYPPVGVPSHRERHDDSVRIMDPRVDMSNTLQLLDKYSVCYVFVDARAQPAEKSDKPLDPIATRAKFTSAPKHFEMVYSDPVVSIFAVRSRAAGCHK